MEECWRLSNHENEEKAEIKQITFQVSNKIEKEFL